MSLLHPAILYGLGLVALPLLVHLLLKQKPKKLLFPALQLVANRRKQNVSRMRLRHFWLLLLRMLVIGLLVVALARPSVPAANYALNLREVLTSLVLLGGAVAGYGWLSHRWKAAAMPQHERRYRQTRLRSGLIGGTLGLLLLLVAWPYQRRIAAELKAPTPAGDVSLPVAAIFLFDTSSSMTYQQEGKTRLDVAREVAIEHLGDLSAGSRVAVADVSNDNPILFQTTISGAKSRIEALEPHPVSLPMNERIRAALRLHQDDRARTLAEQGRLAEAERKDRYLRRIYVLSDLARSAFQAGGASRLAEALTEQANVNLFLVDVSEERPLNTAVLAVEPSRVQLSEEESLTVQATISRIGQAASSRVSVTDEAASPEEAAGDMTSPPTSGPVGLSCTAELLLQDRRGRLIKVDQQTVDLTSATQQVVTFTALKPEGGPVVHGEVRLVSSDPLPFDDLRRFTVERRPATPVLVVSGAVDDGQEWQVALEVTGYRVEVCRPEELSRISLSDFAVVNLINVPALPDNDWYRLGQFVEQGGGLAVFLGSPETSYRVSYRREEAQVFLPGQPDVHSAPDVCFLRISNTQHPLFRQLAADDGMALLEAADIFRFWRVEPAEDARVLARYSEEREAPALLERTHGQGRTIMMTTAVDVKGFRKDWNILPSPQGPVWTFLAFADEMMRYLSHLADSRLTYDAGETPLLRLTAEENEQSFLLQTPGFRQTRLTLPRGETRVVVSEANTIGHYDLRLAGEASTVVSGFSVNPKASESDLTRIAADELDELFGEQRYQVARSIGQLQESISIADLGRELFPLILTMLIVFFIGEHFVANWFYDDQAATDARSSWTSTTPTPSPTSSAAAPVSSPPA